MQISYWVYGVLLLSILIVEWLIISIGGAADAVIPTARFSVGLWVLVISLLGSAFILIKDYEPRR